MRSRRQAGGRVTGAVRGALLAAWLGASGQAAGAVIINEIMYHPYAAPGTTNHLEFIEIRNSGSTAEDLTDYAFRDGVDFNFPPGRTLPAGGYLVVSENLTEFRAAYPAVTNVIGDYSGGLRNSGERLTLSRQVAGEWQIVDTVRYLDSGPADGDGPSLELVNPGFAVMDRQCHGAWAASSINKGTPGAANRAHLPSPLPVAGEVTHAPALPPAGSSLLITAFPAAAAGSSVSRTDLLYRKDGTTPWLSLEMNDEGRNGDAAVGDGTYSVRTPVFGEAGFAEGEIMEFRIRVADSLARTNTIPAANTAGAQPPWSHYVKFGSDTDFNGEYPTYHIVLTAANRAALLAQTSQTNVYPLLDATFITSGGEVLHGCGVRQRGGSSRVFPGFPFNYRVEFPQGERVDGYRDINLNHNNAINQYLGHTAVQQAGYGNAASEVELCRVWLNEQDMSLSASQKLYVRLEKIGGDYPERHFTNDWGNLYQGKDDYANLAYLPNPLSYNNGFWIADTNNPLTVWSELQNLCLYINQPESTYPAQLSRRVNVRQWARVLATMVAINNNEAGLLCPRFTRGDDFAMYADPATGQFHLLPWDMDSVFNDDKPQVWNWNNEGNESARVRKLLFNDPMVRFYVGDVLDLCDTALGDTNFTALLDGVGSKLTSSQRSSYLSTAAALRTNLRNAINTNFTVVVSSTITSSPPQAVIVNSGSVPLSGQAPQNYTALVRVNGVNARWTPWDTANMRTTFGKWETTANLSLASGANRVRVETFDSYTNVLRSVDLVLVNRATSVNRSGTIASNTTWNNSQGVIVLTAPLTVQSGATLTITSGTTLLVNSGAGITLSGGNLDVKGSAAAPVWFLSGGGAASFTLSAGSAGSSLNASNTVFSGAVLTAASGTTLALTDCEIRDNTAAAGIVRAAAGSAATLRRCVLTGFAKTSLGGTSLADSCLFRDFSDAGIEVPTGVCTALKSTLRSGTSGAADGIRVTNSATLVAWDVKTHGLGGAGIRSSSSAVVRLDGVLAYGCGTGLRHESSGLWITDHATLNACGTGFRGNQSVSNTIAWGNTVSVTNGPAAVTRSDIELPATTNAYAGAANLNRNPWFRDAAGGDHRLLPISPCIGAGAGGSDMGARFPAGADPVAPSGLLLSDATTGSVSRILLAWTDNSADETVFHVQRRTVGGAWTTVATRPAGSTGWTDATVLPNRLYTYRVRAAHARGESLFAPEQAMTAESGGAAANLTRYLRFTEVMYNPTGADDATEFFELKNISASTTLDLSGLYTDNDRFSFTNGTTLAPQAFFVIARNSNAFFTRYGFRPRGVYRVDDRLSNSGETLWIRTAAGEEVARGDYRSGTEAGWFPLADGNGYSIVATETNPTTENPETPFYWRASTNPGGSPGANDPPSSYGRIVINEILAHADDPLEDAIELFNAGTTAVNIANWYLSDISTNLTKYRITANITLQPGQFHVFYEGTSFNSPPGGPGTFALSELGEEVILSSGNGSQLTGYRTRVAFGATENGVSFGQHLRSDGLVVYEPMAAHTFGSDAPATVEQFRTGAGKTNSLPRVPAVIISEIMYNPAATGKEFIELVNRTAGPVALYEPLSPTNTWRLDGGVRFSVPTGVVLQAGERALVTGVPPAEFRAAFGLTSPTLKVWGPFDGDLNNAGETIEWLHPDRPEPDGFVPYFRAERVQYGDAAPWPEAADNGGPSLERISPSVHANEPAHWMAATFGGTPGVSNNTALVPAVSFRLANSAVNESAGSFGIEVVMDPVATVGSVTVQYLVTPLTASPSDYTLAGGTLRFWPHDASKTIVGQVKADGVSLEPDETVRISLTGVSSNARLGGVATHILTFRDTNPGTPARPQIQPAASDFFDALAVTLTGPAQAALYYTTDGSQPVVASASVPGGYELTDSARLYTTNLTLGASTLVKAVALIGSYNASSVTQRQFLALSPPWDYSAGTLSRYLRVSADDAEEWRNAFNQQPVLLDGAQLDMGWLAYRRLIGGLRFNNIAIPRGAIVTNAYIQFTAAAAGSGALTHTVRVQDSANAPPFTASLKNLSNRATLPVSASWTLPDWTAAGERGAGQRTPSLIALVQAMVNRPDWTAGAAMAFLISYEQVSGRARPAHSCDGAVFQAPQLFVQWYVPSAADTDGDGLPDAWELLHFGATDAANGGPLDDWDNDRFLNLEEYVADTVPTNSLSLLVLTGFEPMAVPPRLTWRSVTSRFYSVHRSTNLLQPWPASPAASNLRGDASGLTTYLDTNAPVGRTRFYRVTTRLP